MPDEKCDRSAQAMRNKPATGTAAVMKGTAIISLVWSSLQHLCLARLASSEWKRT